MSSLTLESTFEPMEEDKQTAEPFVILTAEEELEEGYNVLTLEHFREKLQEVEVLLQRIKESNAMVPQMDTDFWSSTNESDTRSIYVGNVDYGTTATELEEWFRGCGAINRVTILVNAYTGHPKGFAFLEFASTTSVPHALGLDSTIFRGRRLKVMMKRTNIPGMKSHPRRRWRRRSSRRFRSRGRPWFNRYKRAYHPYFNFPSF